MKPSKHVQKEFTDILNANKGLIISELYSQTEITYYPQAVCKITVGSFFITSLNLIVTVVNTSIDQGEILHFKNLLDFDDFMTKLCGSIITLFPNTTFRSKRRIILDAGELISSVMERIDTPANTYKEHGDIRSNTTFNRYEVLTDIDWIEDTINNWYIQSGISAFPMVPFD
ncbi:hypothetical protein MH215_10125 [Paenibacillus sp. ACRSA]|uniref:hypothetical protein n=1 Tax=Paenibacillus sp. ACRSA TaxID=2918211 RepID=UPI001EF6A26E|nr:hypothetical protein [Paenibacillus sp. ACRSA]MCG7377352.1 hypothetical protein [Paenibacillus sp. ACRSA]